MSARGTCFSILKEICIQKRYSNLVLQKKLEHIEGKDKGLVTQIVYGTLQNYRYCRFQWESYVNKMDNDEVALLLDMSVYQMLFMDKVPSYAIINDAVEITKRKINGRYGNLVNAVLHKVDKAGRKEPSGKKEQVLAIRTSHPDWIVSMWIAQYGYETAEKICESNLEIKPVTARVNTLKTNRNALMETEPLFVKGHVAVNALHYQGNHLAATTYYQDGLVSIQDEASQLVADLVDPQPGEKILDVCSAPGTKACHMAELMKDEGEILCGDIHEHRVELIKEGANRLGISCIKAEVMDAVKLEGLEEESFDRVLCDVPCSGYGVLANKSDIKYHMNSSDMDTLIPLQKEILNKAGTMIKPGGVLVYSTCTLNKKENEKQIEQFLKTHEDFTLVSQETVFPFTYQSDGFFMAKLVKKQTYRNALTGGI